MKIFTMKKFILLLSFLSLIFVFVLGQEINKFFEIQLQTTNKFRLGSKVLIQPIVPYNDFLSGISFWVDNPKISDINIKLKDKNENIIFNGDFNVPVLTSTYWGSEYFFPFKKNIKINSGEEYKIIIQPKNLSELNFYYLYLYELLQGTEEKTYVFESIKELLVNNEPSNKFLKLALYEGKEYLPPQISNFEIKILSPTETEISFNANEPINYKFEYFDILQKTTSTYEIKYYESCPAGIRDCSFQIVTQSGQTYRYVFKASDYWENFVTLIGEWTTPQEKFQELNKEKNEVLPSSVSESNQITEEQKKDVISRKPQQVPQTFHFQKEDNEKQILTTSGKEIYKETKSSMTTFTPTLTEGKNIKSELILKKLLLNKKFSARIYEIFLIIFLLGILIFIIYYRKFK